jgi:hypothetical protein
MRQELYKKLMNKPVPLLSDTIRRKLEESPEITPLNFQDKNKLLWDSKIQDEIGCTLLPSGSWLVGMKTEMPGVTRDMIDWWFWWHAQEKERYQIWFPGEHYNNRTAKKDAQYFRNSFSGFKPNTQFPVERVGAKKLHLSIQFVTPQQFGFDVSMLEKNKIETIVCGHVGILHGIIVHTEMSHIFKKNIDGLTLISRFWMGEHLPKFIKCRLIKLKEALGMAEHCSREYSNLAIILSELYTEFR